MIFVKVLIILSLSNFLHADFPFLKPISQKNPVIENLVNAFGDRNTLLIIDNEGPLKTSEFITANHIPVFVGDLRLVKGRKEFNENTDFESRNSAISLGTLEQFYTKVFPKILDNNPKQKLLAILRNFDVENISQIFEQVNEKFQLCRLYIANAKSFIENSPEIEIFTSHMLAAHGPKIIKFSFNETHTKELKLFEQKRFLQWNKNPMRIFYFKAYLRAKVDKKFNPESLELTDGEILKIFAEKFNFTIKFVFSPDNENYGYRMDNGTFTGSLGMLEYERADMAGNGKLVIDYETSNMLMLPPITMTHFIFVFPKKQWSEMNMIQNYYKFVDSRIYTIMIVLFLILPGIIFLIEISGNSKLRSLNFLIKIYVNFLAILTFVSVKFPPRWPSKFIVNSFVLVCFVLGNIFAGKITEFLYGNTVLKDIQTIEELLGSDFEIKIPTSLTMLFKVDGKEDFHIPKSHRLIQKIIKKVDNTRADVHADSVRNGMAFIESIVKRRIAVLTSLEFTEFLSALGDDKVAYTKSSYSYFSSMAIRKTLPMLTAMGQLQLEINAAGIPQFQYNLAKITQRDVKRIRWMAEGIHEIKGNTGEITLKQISTIFMLWADLLTISICVFLIEILIGNLRRINWRKLFQINR